MINTTVILDVDGVMLNWVDGFRGFMANVMHVQPSVKNSNMYDLSDAYPSVNVASCVAAFNASDNFGQLMPFDDSIAGVLRLRLALPIDQVAWLSSCLTGEFDDMRIERNRHANIHSVYGPAIDGECMSVSIPKWHHVGHGCRWVIEDSARNAAGIVQNRPSARVALLARPYNKGATPDRVTRVDDWNAACRLIIGDLYK